MTEHAHVHLDRDVPSYLPGEVVEGVVDWTYDAVPWLMQLRLVWRTDGKGTAQHTIEREEAIAPAVEGEYRFRMKLPDLPYTFHGRVLAIDWYVELSVKMPYTWRSYVSTSQRLVMSATGAAIEPYSS